MMKFLRGSALAAACLFAPAAQAFESHTLFEKGLWSATLEVYDAGHLGCSMKTFGRDYSLALYATQDRDGVRLMVVNHMVSLSSGSRWVDATIQIDNRRGWTLYNVEDAGTYAVFNITGYDGVRLVKEIAAGREIFFGNAYGEVITSWSLAGSAAAMVAMNDCLDKIE